MSDVETEIKQCMYCGETHEVQTLTMVFENGSEVTFVTCPKLRDDDYIALGRTSDL